MSADDRATDPAVASSTVDDGSSHTALMLAKAAADSPQAAQLPVAIYIESIAAELRAMANAAGLGSLAYFLEMVRVEASIQVTAHASEALMQPQKG